MSKNRPPLWEQVLELFRRHGHPAPPVRLRDEIVSMIVRGDDKGRRIAELEDELEEARDELANPVWPKWARSITEQLEKYGVEVDPFEGWDLPVDLEDWLSEAVRIETEKLKVLVKSDGWKITYDDGRTEYAELNPGLGESGNGLIVSVDKF